MIDSFPLRGRVALVAGASSGIGFASSLLLSEMGAKIIAIAKNKERLESSVKQLYGEGHICFPCDLTNPKDLELLTQKIEVTCPHIVVANFFSRIKPKRTDQLNEDYFQWMEENMKYVFTLLKHSLPFQRKENFGRWIAISSSLVEGSGPGNAAYVSVKHSLESIFKTIAIEEAKYNITANIIRPGFIDTKGTRENYSNSLFDRFSQMNVLRRAGKPSEVAHAVGFFSHPNASFITGANLSVDGGFSLGWEIQEAWNKNKKVDGSFE